MKVAALDLGTNTFLLLIAEVTNGAIQKVLHDEVQVVRLGQRVHENRRFHPEALKRADDCFTSFSRTIRSHGVEKILACATSAARDVTNGADLISLGDTHGIPIEIISGVREAELTFLGTIDDASSGPVRIIDVGGGSTEIISGEGKKLLSRTSVDVGSVRLTEIFVSRHPIPESELDQMRTYLTEKFSNAAGLADSRAKVIAVAGTPTTLATVEQGLAFESERVHGFLMSVERLKFWARQLAGMSVEERQGLAGMEPKRADVIVAGALTLLSAAETLGATTLQVSVRGLRYGVARTLGA